MYSGMSVQSQWTGILNISYLFLFNYHSSQTWGLGWTEVCATELALLLATCIILPVSHFIKHLPPWVLSQRTAHE